MLDLALPVEDKKLDKNSHEVLAERAARFRREENHSHEDKEEMIVFEECGTRYAVPLRMFAEIRPITKMTALPLVSNNIRGLINFRGKIVAIYSLASSLNKSADTSTAAKQQSSALIGYGVAGHVALFAESVVETINVSHAEICAVPISLSAYDYIAGVGSDGMIFLDMEKLVNNSQFYMA